MLYLIRSFGRIKKFLKVGYTGNLKQRMSSYLVENPGYELISTRGGDMIGETKLHLYLTSLGLKEDFLEEWFIDSPKVLQEFHQTWEKIDRVIWKNRDYLFTTLDFSKRSGKILIYEELRFKFRNCSNMDIYTIDKEWKTWNLQKDIKGRQKLIEEGYLFI